LRLLKTNVIFEEEIEIEENYIGWSEINLIDIWGDFFVWMTKKSDIFFENLGEIKRKKKCSKIFLGEIDKRELKSEEKFLLANFFESE